MVSALGHISGAHFNPAVTAGFVVTRRIAPTVAAAYVLAQLAAATAAMLVLRVCLREFELEPGVPVVAEEVSAASAVAIEAVLTFFLVVVVFATAVDPRGTFKSIAGLAIGLTITFDILMGGALTGAAMNPARAFGPQLVESVWDDGWVYYAGLLLGGTAAALLYEYLFLCPLAPVLCCPPDSGVAETLLCETAVS